MQTNKESKKLADQRQARFNFIYKTFAKKVFVLFCNRGVAFSDDLCQDFFAKVWELLGSRPDEVPLNSDPHLKNWIFRVAINAAIDALRKSQRESRNLADPNGEDLNQVASKSESCFARWEFLNELNNILSPLPNPQHRDILILFIQGYSYKDLAFLFQVTESAIKNVMYRSRILINSKKYNR